MNESEVGCVSSMLETICELAREMEREREGDTSTEHDCENTMQLFSSCFILSLTHTPSKYLSLSRISFTLANRNRHFVSINELTVVVLRSS